MKTCELFDLPLNELSPFQKEFRKLHKLAGNSQQAIAAVCGRKQGAVSKWKRLGSMPVGPAKKAAKQFPVLNVAALIGIKSESIR